jgi:hypothetical protein
MSAVVEEHIVTGFQSQADRSGEGFDTSGRIECEVSGTCAQANGIGKAGWSIGSGHTKVVESHLAGNEDAECARAGLEFRSEKTMERPQARGHGRRADAVVEGAGVVALEIVGHLGFELHAGSNPESCPAT